ncbi:DUF397 domain-containing protein [Streptomyces sp. PTM05]|uniref:DUF397 domain-containing protein n=1 Tax=Streptantibioticus parmotrematis TaxID=2873249 RepID=A0ABS7QNS6_9ACTN|nr:DUF397 domain-containing protein [Streptantibioticus parmotrematis]MBY8884842.1 DUF397 domain-containing protein [Streptantibioticus parmotrematis]
MIKQPSRHGVTAAWKKSSYSGAHGDCVEVRAPGPQAIAVRDSKNPQGPALSFSSQAWAAFVADVEAGAFDRG